MEWSMLQLTNATKKDATTNDATTKKYYNEQILSIKSRCYNERRCCNEREGPSRGVLLLEYTVQMYERLTTGYCCCGNGP